MNSLKKKAENPLETGSLAFRPPDTTADPRKFYLPKFFCLNMWYCPGTCLERFEGSYEAPLYTRFLGQSFEPGCYRIHVRRHYTAGANFLGAEPTCSWIDIRMNDCHC